MLDRDGKYRYARLGYITLAMTLFLLSSSRRLADRRIYSCERRTVKKRQGG